MSQITVEIPDTFLKLPEKERDSLVRAGLFEAVNARIRQLKRDISESQAHIQQFEKQYGLPLERFVSELLPTLTSYEAHEDYNSWFYWETVLNTQSDLLQQLEQMD